MSERPLKTLKDFPTSKLNTRVRFPSPANLFSMPDFFTRCHGTWHFVRRVPIEFAQLDKRGVVKHSTHIKIANDRAGRRAARVADKFNE